MSRAATHLLFASLFAAAATSVLAATSPEDALRTRLTERYPAVQRWVIRAFANDESEQGEAARLEVVRLGSRSAVRVGRRLHWYYVEGFQSVVSADHRLGAGASLDAIAVSIEERDVLAAGCTPITDAEALNGMRTRRALRDNEVICRELIEPRPVVARGEMVTVRYVGQRIHLVTKGVAQADANLGDELAVRSLASSDSFHALVSGVGEVTLHE